MAVTYEWKITTLRVENVENVENAIYDVRFKVTGTDEEESWGTFRGSAQFDIESLNVESFTPFYDLTEEQVIGWVKQSLDKKYTDRMYKLIDKQIKDRKIAYRTTEEIPANKMPWTIQPKHLESE